MITQSPAIEIENGTFLNAVDFFNARFVSTNIPLKPRLNDQHFYLKRNRRGSVVAFDTDKWPQGRVPYVLSSAYTTSQRAVLARAIASYNAKTCIRFVPKTASDKDYIAISKIDGCYADFARVGGKQQVSLADECVDYPTVIHELMHVIGFIHEHQRDDRDGYVRIVWENIINGANSDFDKLSSVGLSNYGESYDYFSIMHYENTEGSKNGKSTIEAKVPAFTSLMVMNKQSVVAKNGKMSNPNRQSTPDNALNPPNRRMNEPKRVKPHFSKKLAQLDATMKIIAIKVDQKVWEEKYLEAEELQEVLVWLRKVHKRLKELLTQQEQNIDRDDYRAAYTAKQEYEQTLKESVDLQKIQRLLTPTEYNTLLSLKNP
uniref:Metalloendopeptidase n=1 Tax=Panagrolaimus sp. JU765 TaxID=591449 RepID=A0AC34REU5_9BILA